MGPNQTYKLLHSKGDHKQNKKTTFGLGEYICKWCDQQGLNFQNIQTAHTIQQQQKKAGTSLVVQWLTHHAANAGALALIPGQATVPHMLQLKIPHTAMKIPHSATKIPYALNKTQNTTKLVLFQILL